MLALWQLKGLNVSRMPVVASMPEVPGCLTAWAYFSIPFKRVYHEVPQWLLGLARQSRGHDLKVGADTAVVAAVC
jgi:hypothetical protein